MKLRRNRRFFLFLCLLISFLFTFVLLSPLFLPPSGDAEKQENLNIKMRLFRSDTRRTAMELAKPNPADKTAPETALDTAPAEPVHLSPRDRVQVKADYAYLWVEIENNGPESREIYISNGRRNAYTELLAPSPLGAYTLAAHGESVPLSLSPVSFRRASFPVALEGETTRTFIVEFHDPRRIIVAPMVVTPPEFYRYSFREQRYTAFVYGFAFALLWAVLIAGFLEKNRVLYALFFCLTALFLFFLYRSGVVQYIFPRFTYPQGLFSLSLALTLFPAGGLLIWEARTGFRDISGAVPQGKERRLSALSSLRLSIVQQIAHQFRFPMETVLAAGAKLEHEHSEPSVVASAQVIKDEISELKRVLDMHTLTSFDEVFEKQRGLEELHFQWKSSEIYGRILLFSEDDAFISRVSLILRSSHFEVSVTGDYYQILGGVAEKNFDVLLIHPSSVGEKAFELCRFIREEHNMLDIPILMIAFHNRASLIKSGYAAGVNDFVTPPLDGYELATRLASLVKLREIAHNNRDLAESEKEKNVFLYFLTHNVNTPLTLLINRIRELEELLPRGELEETVEDLRESSREISDIVRNVLISFRLADGRQTLLTEEIDVHSLLYSLEGEIKKKCRTKGQEFTVVLPPEHPPVCIDVPSVKGSLYNIIDNAVKFTPPGGRIEVELSVKNHGVVDIEVKDTGPGIPEQEEERLFRRFEPLSPRPTDGESSTGLGLFVAHELIHMNGGTLKYRPYSKGACFTVTLPTYKDV